MASTTTHIENGLDICSKSFSRTCNTQYCRSKSSVNTVEDLTELAVIVYVTPELLAMLKFIPAAKFVPSMDKV